MHVGQLSGNIGTEARIGCRESCNAKN